MRYESSRYSWLVSLIGVLHRDAARAGVQADRPRDEFAGGVAGGPAQQRANASQNFLHVERLGDIIVGAGVEALHLLAPPVARGQDQDRHRPTGLAPSLEHGDAVPLGQADVENDRVIGLGIAQKPALLSVEGLVHGVARRFQRSGHLSVEIAIVFDNQKPHGAP